MATWEREWEVSDLFGYDVIDFKIKFGSKIAHWRLYINREMMNSEIQGNSKDKFKCTSSLMDERIGL